MVRTSFPLVGFALVASSFAFVQPAPATGLVQKALGPICGTCHTYNLITRQGHTTAEWNSIVHMMINVGAKLPAGELPVIVDYLAKNFPPKERPAAAIIPGNVTVTIGEWKVPTPGSRPLDPMVAPDGSVWYTGQMADVLGQFDPTTRSFREYRLKTPNSGPDGLVADGAGNVWFAANFAGYIGKLDPATGAITEYAMPDPKARDPRALLLAPNGEIYFTVQRGNMVGRLDPRSGEVHLAPSLTPHSNPAGMAIDSHGVPFFAESGSNKIGRIDPATLAVHEYVLPNAQSRPRRIAVSADDMIWYSDTARGFLGRLDPKTGEVEEWPSPGGLKSAPDGVTVVGGAIWYSESNTRPNTLVRFDTKKERFETWAIPSGGVRAMAHTPDGDLWLANSDVNKIAFVKVTPSPR